MRGTASAAQTAVAAARGSRRERRDTGCDAMRRRVVVVQRGYGMRCREDVCVCVSTKERLVRWGAGGADGGQERGRWVLRRQGRPRGRLA
jgi:hypothetical protein